MRSSMYTFLALAAVSYASANSVGDGYIAFNLESIPAASDLEKRQGSLTTTTIDNATSYVVNLSIGSDSQQQTVVVDTGSTELWVHPTCATGRTAAEIKECNSLPKYDPETSTTSQNLSTPFTLRYGDGSGANGTYFKDDIKLANKSLTGQIFGYATSTRGLRTGILGLGRHDPKKNYPTVIENLAAQKQINSVAFSLDLRALGAPSGSVIFGGIDSKKYQCSLEKLDILPPPASDPYPRYTVYLKNIGTTLQGKSKTYDSEVLNTSVTDANGLPTLLDSGATIQYLPYAAIRAIAADWPGAQLDSNSTQTYIVPCTPPAGSVDYTFGNKTIRVPFSELVRRSTSGSVCLLGIGYNGRVSLGDTFLRSAYVVYDVDNSHIWVDQAADCGTNITAIGSGPDAVPQIRGCNCGGNATTTGPSSSKPTSGGSASPSGTNTNMASTDRVTLFSIVLASVLAVVLVA